MLNQSHFHHKYSFSKTQSGNAEIILQISTLLSDWYLPLGHRQEGQFWKDIQIFPRQIFDYKKSLVTSFGNIFKRLVFSWFDNLVHTTTHSLIFAEISLQIHSLRGVFTQIQNTFRNIQRNDILMNSLYTLTSNIQFGPVNWIHFWCIKSVSNSLDQTVVLTKYFWLILYPKQVKEK